MQNTILQRSQGVRNWVVTAVLWLSSSVIAFWEILVIRDIGIELYLRLASGSVHVPSGLLADQASAIGQIFVIIGGIIAIAIVPGSADFHYRHFGTSKSWRIFGYTFAFQLLVLVLALLI